MASNEMLCGRQGFGRKCSQLRSTLQFKHEMKAVDKSRTQQAGWVLSMAEIRKLYCKINLDC